MSKKNRDLKTELVEMQLAAQHWEDKYIELQGQLQTEMRAEFQRGVDWARGRLDVPGPEAVRGVSYGDPSSVGDEDLPEEEPNLNTPEGDSDFEVTP